MTESRVPPPPGWGNDEFTRFLEHARGNQFATFVRKPAVKNLLEIDNCFQRIEQGWINPKPWFATLFMFRTHAAYRAALGVAMAGQTFEVFPLLRSCLECAAYGLHVRADEDRANIWLRRHDDSKAHKRMRREFAADQLRKTIQTNSETMLTAFDEMYDRTIDFGGHPNEQAILSNMIREEREDRTEFLTVFLQGNGFQLDHALKTTAQVGIWALHAFQLIYPERFMLLGVKRRLEKLRKRL